MKFYLNFLFKGIFLTKHLVMTQGETVRILEEIAKQKFTSVPGRKEKSTTYQTRKTYGNSIKAGKPTTEGCGGRGKGEKVSGSRKRAKCLKCTSWVVLINWIFLKDDIICAACD